MKWIPGLKFGLLVVMAILSGLTPLGFCAKCELNENCTNIVLFDGDYTGPVPLPNSTCSNQSSESKSNTCAFSFDMDELTITNLTSLYDQLNGLSTTLHIAQKDKQHLQNFINNPKPNAQALEHFLRGKPYKDEIEKMLNIQNPPGNTTDKYKCTYETLGFWLVKNDIDQYQLNITRNDIRPKANIFFVTGKCNMTGVNAPKCEGKPIEVYTYRDCNITCLNTEQACTTAKYETCQNITTNDDFIKFQGQTPSCSKCGTPVQPVELEIKLTNTTISFGEDSKTDKAEVMKTLTSDVLAQMGNKTTASVSLGEVQGIFVKPKDKNNPETTSFVYSSATNLNIIQDKTQMDTFPTLISVPKEAFEKAISQNISTVFTAVFRMPRFTKDEMNSTVLNDEVYSIDMGAEIANLTNTINITFRSVDKKSATPRCFSWSGSGSKPNWTTEGCNTTGTGESVTCECEHLTFFAVLMIPNTDNTSIISSADLSNLTYITSIGCGLSVFFLCVALFMHFLMRRARKSEAAQILINLLVALVLLDLTFLTNEYVANTKNVIGCKLMAGFMHYCLLCTFTWFGLEALHLCLQLATISRPITHYLLKVQIAGWAPPAIVVTVLFFMKKYDRLVIQTDTGNSVAMCWIIDSSVHYVVNIGYYSVIFAFTFTTFVVMLRWIVLLKRTTAGRKKEASGSGKRTGTGTSDILTIMGLCFTLGVTWGFAFFAYGALRLPSYYIFTILNSFQGFFLFIYYYKTSKFVGESTISAETSNTTEATQMENPYEKQKNF